MDYALIGCGRVSPNHIVAAYSNGLRIAALCDISPVAPALIKEQYPFARDAREYVDYREMLDDPGIKIVAVATDSGSHASIAIDCIRAGKNVIIEKPVALSLEDCDRIISAAAAAGVKVCACHQNRFNKSIQKIRTAVEQNRFGEIYHATSQIRWSRGEQYYSQAPWRGTWKCDGGTMMNQCIHNIDLLRWMLGDDIDEVYAMTDRRSHPYIEAEDEGFALIRFKNGAYGVVEGTVNIKDNDLEETLCIFGKNGSVKAEGIINNLITVWDFADGLDDPQQVTHDFCETPPNVYGYGHTPLYKDFISAVQNNTQPYVDLYAGRRAVELVLAIYKSSAENRPVKLPLSACSTTDFTGRFDMPE